MNYAYRNQRKGTRPEIREKLSSHFNHLLQSLAYGRVERAREFSLHSSSRSSVNTSARQKVESDAQLLKFIHIL
jgi:hypothetical protein